MNVMLLAGTGMMVLGMLAARPTGPRNSLNYRPALNSQRAYLYTGLMSVGGLVALVGLYLGPNSLK